MALPLHRSWTPALVALPETGMGYQIVELRNAGPRPEHVLVANAAEVIEPAKGRMAVREGIEKAAEERIAKVLQGPVEQAEFRVLTRNEAVVAKALAPAPPMGGGPASTAPVELSVGEERFFRFSAFANDARILPGGAVSPGTYVTTYDDGLPVKTGTEAVRRYALPNPTPAVNRFHLKPPSPIRVQRGTVQPAFGQPGGGVEVIFVAGARAGTLFNKDTIPPV